MKQISDIRPCGKYRNRLDIFVNGEYFYTVNKNFVLDNELTTGSNIENKEMFIQSCRGEELEKATSNALRYLSQSRTRQEILKKLSQMRYSTDIINDVLNKLGEWGYINDQQYVQDFINHYTKSGYGRYAVLKKLEQKGIHDTTLEWDESESARAFANKKLRKQNDEQTRIKTARAMYARGYSSTTIRNVLREFGEIADEERNY